MVDFASIGIRYNSIILHFLLSSPTWYLAFYPSQFINYPHFPFRLPFACLSKSFKLSSRSFPQSPFSTTGYPRFFHFPLRRFWVFLNLSSSGYSPLSSSFLLCWWSSCGYCAWDIYQAVCIWLNSLVLHYSNNFIIVHDICLIQCIT